jgi:molybdenum cofactor biosynthesis enzyme MoaA
MQLQTLCYRITQHCNLSCSHCRSGSSPSTRVYSSTGEFLDFATRAQRELGLRHVSISGGEPALVRELPEVLEGLTFLGLFVSVTTNGTLTRKLPLASIANLAGRVRFRVSIDGPAKQHDAIRGAGTHAAALRSLQQVRDAMGWVAVNTVAALELLPVADELAAVVMFVMSWNVDEWALITPVPQGTALGRPWFPESLVPAVHSLKAALVAAGFSRRIVVWDFLSTPETSVLVEANGDIVLSGLGRHESVITTLRDCDFVRLREVVESTQSVSPKSHFSWKDWE